MGNDNRLSFPIWLGPLKSTLLQSFVINAKAVLLPLQHFDMCQAPVEENEHIPGQQGRFHVIGDDTTEPVKALPHRRRSLI
jgi:hypothetical protein